MKDDNLSVYIVALDTEMWSYAIASCMVTWKTNEKRLFKDCIFVVFLYVTKVF